MGNHKIFFIIWQKKNIDCFVKIDNKKVFDKKNITSDDAEKILTEAMHKIVLDEYDACA